MSTNTFNSDHFDMTKWYLTLPVDADGGITGTALNIQKPVGYESKYFYDATDGGMVFMSPVIGATTTHTYGTRSELRELNPDGSYAFWNLAQGGTLTATVTINSVPSYDDGSMGKQIIGQIHGSSHELVRLYYEDGTVYFKNDRSGTTNTEHKFLLTDANGDTPHIALGEKFSYEIDAHGSTLTVKVITATDVYSSVTAINSYWDTDTLYFKAGVYLGVTSTENVDVPHGSGYGQDTFYGLDFSHAAGQGLGGLIGLGGSSTGGSGTGGGTGILGTAGNDTLNADHDAGTVVSGLAGNDYLVGHDGNDTLNGGDGADKLYGYWGNDTLYGGTGNDMLSGGPGANTYIFKAGDGNDTITDFHAGKGGDIMDLSGYKTVSSFADLHFTQQGKDTLMSFGTDGSVLLKNIGATTLTSDNFHIVPVTVTPPSTGIVVNGTASAETLNADHDHDSTVNGLGGNDSVIGHDGNDILYGGDGNDKLYGFWGNDVIVGGNGADTMSGGPGSDTFKINNTLEGGDIISDFHHVTGDSDILDLAALFVTNGLGAVDTATAIQNGNLVLSQHTDGLHVDFDKDGSAGSAAAVHLVTLTGTDQQYLDVVHQILTHTA